MAPPKKTKNLFPDSWVVGPAAAELARNDVGVLLADDPRAAELARVADAATEPRSEAAPGLADEGHLGDEIAELKRENARLQRRIAASRGRLSSMAGSAEEQDAGIGASAATAAAAFGPADTLYGDERPGFSGRRPARARLGRNLGVAALLAALVVIGAAWIAGGQLAGRDSTVEQRLRAIGVKVEQVVSRVDADRIRRMTNGELQELKRTFNEFREWTVASLGRSDSAQSEAVPPGAPEDTIER